MGKGSVRRKAVIKLISKSAVVWFDLFIALKVSGR